MMGTEGNGWFKWIVFRNIYAKRAGMLVQNPIWCYAKTVAQAHQMSLGRHSLTASVVFRVGHGAYARTKARLMSGSGVR
jgi:hypothetical protein